MEIKEFKNLLPKYKAIMGFDYGSKRLGIAVSDLLLMVASNHSIITRTNLTKDIEQIKKIVAEKEVGAFVFGLPLQMNGIEGDTAIEVRAFAQKLLQEINLPCFFWDERLSSSAMESFLIKEVDMNRKRRKEVLDASCASYILQGVLDALSRI